MIAALLLLLQVQLADSATTLTVRNGTATATIPIVFTRSGAMLRLSAAAVPLGAPLRRPDAAHVTLRAGETDVELTLGALFARVGGQVVPLTIAPVEREGEVYVPLGLLTDVIPRLVAGFVWDARRGELRRFQASVTPAPPPTSGTSTTVDPSRAVRPPPRPPAHRIVVVDAGHGGPDRGMSGPIGSRNRIYEADITLAVSRLVRDELLSRGVQVVMTRFTDTLIALTDRGRIANRAKADLFLSVHVNAANLHWRAPSDARGFETYFLAEAKTEDEARVAAVENEAVKYEAESNAQAGDPLSFILNDMKQNEYLRESSDLADIVQRRLGTVHPGTNRGVKQAGFRVLLSAFMPAVLVEIGFGTNRADAGLIASSEGQHRIARAIADATMEYLSRYDRRATQGTGQR